MVTEKKYEAMIQTSNVDAYSKATQETQDPDKRVIDFDHFTACMGLDLVQGMSAILATKDAEAKEFVRGIVSAMIETTLSEAIEMYIKATLITAKLDPEGAWEKVTGAAATVAALYTVQEVFRHEGEYADALECMERRLGAIIADGPGLTDVTTPGVNVLRTRRPGGLH